jgi:hypothetical protein
MTPRHASMTGDPSRRRRRRDEKRRWSRRAILILVIIGALMAGVGAYATSQWLVGLGAGSSGQAESGSVLNLTISAVAAPAPSNVLYPGGTGDVEVTIANPNPFPVTITAFDLPTDTTYATGYTSSSLTTTQTGCLAATPSDVLWNFTDGTSGSSHTLTTPLTVAASGGANNPLTVTLVGDAAMTESSPAACESTFFSMPSLTDVEAIAGGTTPTTSPSTDGWTS